MVTLQEVESQLKEIGCNFRFFGRPEIKELAKILQPGETIARATNGLYEGGFALLCVTNERLLLIDRKPMFLTIEDVRFDMIAEIDFNHRLLNATVNIYSTNKSLTFTSWNHDRLRKLVEHLQQRVMQIRHQHAAAVGEQLHTRMQEQFGRFQQQPTRPHQYIAVPATPDQNTTYQSSTTGSVPQESESQAIIAPLAYLAMQNGGAPAQTANPYGKVPLLARRRKFPSFY